MQTIEAFMRLYSALLAYCTLPTVKLDAVVELQDAMLLLMQLFAIKLLQLSLNVVVPVVVVSV